MARIRSIHPGLFTDEVFMAASAAARILMIGLWTEADDQGVFEWKPLTIKARLLPADPVDTSAVLQELTEAQVIRRFEHDGKSFGAIRNFRKFQRPQKPKNKHQLPDALRSYVGLSGSESILVQDEDDTEQGKSPQMEEEGGRREEERKDNNPINSKNGSGKYAFEFGVVKLNQHDLDQWKHAFPHVGVEAELMAAEPWLAKQPSWFQAAAGLLAKKERAAVIALERARAPPSSRRREKDPLGNWVEVGDDG